MKFKLKVVYKDKVEPTTLVDSSDESTIVNEVTALVKDMLHSGTIQGIYVAKNE